MISEYFIVCTKINILQANTNLKLLHVVLILLMMAVVSTAFYKYASMVLLLITFILVIYILTSEFLRMKAMHDDLKVACSIPE